MQSEMPLSPALSLASGVASLPCSLISQTCTLACILVLACIQVGGSTQGCVRKGGGVGWDTPHPWVLVWSPPKAGRKFLSLNPLGAEGAEAKFWLSASNIGREGRGGGDPGAGGTPPPPTVYERSNTSLGLLLPAFQALLTWPWETRPADT